MDKSPGRKKTTIDYDLTDTTTANTVKEMKYMKKNMDNINQRKIQQPIKNKNIYSNYNFILVILALETPKKKKGHRIK